ncbi:phage tail completion protein [Kluyvera georgiana ATCC 51603]|uniref:Prophage minor tail protein Z (GPZ) n=2 Tax=Kluyvera TaxID=579 RepID=A0A485ABE1_KLUCR|nr:MULTISPECIES: phage tail protein [Kluyvera]OAT52131.1 phage tail completion protein [Kluyvera georgiana ATCC 51603]WNN70339.1 phage tail protein [Kluyvera cryocrescens]VFS57631.1 Prophage minor tail protein Z (GPZ) [Kluyvera cryocrescens]
MSIKGLEQAMANLNSISSTAVPRASAQAVNRVATRAVSRSVAVVSKDTRVPRKLVKQRARIRRATTKKPRALIRVNRGNLPAIKLGTASVRLSRRKRDKKGANSELRIGPFRFPGGFIQQLKNGRWHVMRRTSKPRYPIEVVSIPLATPLTNAFRDALPKLMESDMPKELRASLKNQLRLILKR